MVVRGRLEILGEDDQVAAHFQSLGHQAVGLDGSLRFVERARAATGCQVLHQSFLHLDLPARRSREKNGRGQNNPEHHWRED